MGKLSQLAKEISKHTIDDMPKLMNMFSEKKTYIIHAHSMFDKNKLCPITAIGRIHVTKVKTSQDKKDQFITYEILDQYNEDGELVKFDLVTDEIKTMRLFDAVPYVQNIEMFQMWVAFNNAKRRGDNDLLSLAESILDILIDRKIETIGSSHFEKYEYSKLNEILEYVVASKSKKSSLYTEYLTKEIKL